MNKKGFTLIEIMIVVVIVGLLAGLAIPIFASVKGNSTAGRVSNDLKTLRNAFVTYNLENSSWPTDTLVGEFPPEMAGYISSNIMFGDPGSSGRFNWEGHSNLKAITYVPYSPDDDIARAIDASLDDGNLSGGLFQKELLYSGSYTLIIEDTR